MASVFESGVVGTLIFGVQPTEEHQWVWNIVISVLKMWLIIIVMGGVIRCDSEPLFI